MNILVIAQLIQQKNLEFMVQLLMTLLEHQVLRILRKDH